MSGVARRGTVRISDAGPYVGCPEPQVIRDPSWGLEPCDAPVTGDEGWGPVPPSPPDYGDGENDPY